MNRPAGAAPRRPAALALSVLALIALSALAYWAWQPRRGVPPPPLSSAEAEAQSRRIEVTLGDIQATWARLFRADGRSYAPVAHRFFVRASPSPCAGPNGATGPFYCDRDRTLNFDLGFFAALTPQLREIEEIGGKLIVANLAAGAVQDQLGILPAVAARDPNTSRRKRRATQMALALQADCLTGVWARDAAARLGDVPALVYEFAVQGTRRIAEARPDWGRDPPVELNLLGLGDKAEREVAFIGGYRQGTLAACLSQYPANPPR